MTVELHFGECEGMCGRQVTFPGWDRYCDECVEEMRQEDEERREALAEEDAHFYTVPLGSSGPVDGEPGA